MTSGECCYQMTDSKQTNKNTFKQICKQIMSITVLPSFVYVSRWRPLAGDPILEDLLIQWQWQRSISYRQPQHQSFLSNRDGLIASSTHVLLGVVKTLDRLDRQNLLYFWLQIEVQLKYSLILIWSFKLIGDEDASVFAFKTYFRISEKRCL